MIKELSLRVSPQTVANSEILSQRIADSAGLLRQSINAVRILKRSIDARQREIFVNLTVRVFIDEEPPALEYQETAYHDVNDKPAVIVVGAGPGGLFAALRLIEKNLRPIVLERGKDVHARRKDIAQISKSQQVDPESNYAFGEGGAGAFSDGKLYTRSTKRGNVDKILNVFCQNGADTTILADAHPHIGTDRLPGVIENMRKTIIDHGGDVHFETKVDRLLFNSKHEVCGVGCTNGKTFEGPVILATGHSARDIYRLLYHSGVDLEMKGLAIGVRLEHPASLIDQIMYHNQNGRGKYLPAAEYRMTAQAGGRGVYSFCMCPGGFVIPAASGPQQIVVNGMSPAGRNSKWSNSGIVVETKPEDLDHTSFKNLMERAMSDNDFAITHPDNHESDSPLRMMFLQEALEHECWIQGNHRQTAPAQRMTDFVSRHLSCDLPECSYSPGIVASPLHFWLPSFLSSRLIEGFELFGRHYHGFLTREALLIGIETRTSSPVRITRNPDTLQHIAISGLFPCGEGAGYAGGIVSAAIDGERCADAVAALF
ncbi:MAG: FAD-binding protein [Bacteroidaceae bacterium]